MGEIMSMTAICEEPLFSHGSTQGKLKSSGDESAVKAMLPALALMIAGLLGLIIATLFGDIVPNQYVVIGSPGQTRDDMIAIVAEAEGAILNIGGFENILIVGSERTDFAAALEGAGAWAVFPAPVAFGCDTRIEQRNSV